MIAVALDWTGQTLAQGRYQVLAKLGEGGMAHVFKARHLNLDAGMVIKVPRSALLQDAGFAARFRREVRTLVQVEHPHIVRVLDVDEHDGLPFAVLAYLAGGSLEDQQPRGANGQALGAPAAALAGWLEPIAKALDFIHGEGVIHRDVKPGNILFDKRGHVFLSDFGVAKALDATAEAPRQALTGAGYVLGTPEYMAPELALGLQYDGRADQYALAVTVYEVLCGQVLFTGATGAAVIVRQTNDTPRPVRDLCSQVPAALSEAVQRALDKDPAGRFPDCATFAQAVLGTLPSQTPRLGRLEGPTSQTVTCPRCARVLRVQPNLVGRRVRCPACHFEVPSGAQTNTIKRRPGAGAETVLQAQPTAETSKPQALKAGLATMAEATQPIRRRWKLLLAGLGVLMLLPIGAVVALNGLGGRDADARLIATTAAPRLHLENAELTVAQEGRQRLKITLERRGHEGPVLLALDPLPAGLTYALPQPQQGDTTVLELAAAANAAPGEPRVLIKAAVAGIAIEEPLLVKVELAPPKPARPSAREMELEKQLAMMQQEARKRETELKEATRKAPGPEPVKLPLPPLSNSIGMKFVLIPPGRFKMGSPSDEQGRGYEEGPQKEVELTRAFYLGIYEVTQQEYAKVISKLADPSTPGEPVRARAGSPPVLPSPQQGTSNPGDPPSANTERHPVDQVSWNDAREFCRRLSELPEEVAARRRYRLPTEAEWEYACRAGTTTRFSTGNSLGLDAANIDGGTKSVPVGQHAPNRFGLFDMHGNVGEWCQDYYDHDYYTRSPAQDPCNDSGNSSTRTVRGGSFTRSGSYCRSASRSRESPTRTDATIGFRVVAVVADPP
jgi:formylglycine-generating enzyme required for sulfatase activity/serine/threonine protein kinase